MISFFYKFSFWIILFLFLSLFLLCSSDPKKESMAVFLLIFCSIAYFCIKKLMKGYEFAVKKEKAERNRFFEIVYLSFFTRLLCSYYWDSLETPPSLFLELLSITFFFFTLRSIEILFIKLKKEILSKKQKRKEENLCEKK